MCRASTRVRAFSAARPKFETFDDAVAAFLMNENARWQNGLPVLPPLAFADFGREPAQPRTVATGEIPDVEPAEAPNLVPPARPVWPLVTTALAVGAGLGIWVGIAITVAK